MKWNTRNFITDYFKLFIFSNSISIVTIIYGYFFYINRPLFILEYNIILILIIFRLPFFVYVFLFGCVFLFDVVLHISSIFYFNWADLLVNANFIKFHHSFYLIIAGSIVFFLIVLKCQHFLFRKLITNISTKMSVIYFFSFPIFIVLADILNGSNMLFSNKNVIPANILGSEINTMYVSIELLNPSATIPKPFNCKGDTISASGHIFTAIDSSKKELVIIVESWGILNGFDYNRLNSFFENKAVGNYRIHIDSSCFYGGTTNAELREFLNANGAYNYYLKNTIRNSKQYSLFEEKNKKSYSTIGVHSFSKQMFFRNIWWNNIGINHCYFLEDILHTNNKLTINNETPFSSVFDEDSYDFLSKEALRYDKVFAYLLTVNTHQPFVDRGGYRKKDLYAEFAFKEMLKKYPSSIVPQQVRIFEELNYFISNLELVKWDKVLIIGDHAPPYFSLENREQFNQKMVPFIYLSRKVK